VATLFQNSDRVGEGVEHPGFSLLICLLYNANSAIPIPDLNVLVHGSSTAENRGRLETSSEKAILLERAHAKGQTKFP
jgi:hypothetical protein